MCAGFGWERVHFLHSSWHRAVVWICAENSVDRIRIRGDFVIAEQCTHFYFSNSLPHPTEGEWMRGCVRLSCWLELNHDVFKVYLLLYFQEIYLFICYDVMVSAELSGLFLPDPNCSNTLMPCAFHTVLLTKSIFPLYSPFQSLSWASRLLQQKEAPGPPPSFPASQWIQQSPEHGLESKAAPWKSWWKFHVQFGGTPQHDGNWKIIITISVAQNPQGT